MEGLFEEQHSWDVFVKAETPSVERFCSLERLAGPWTSQPSERATCFGIQHFSWLFATNTCVFLCACVWLVCPCAQYSAILVFVFISTDSRLKFIKEKRLQTFFLSINDNPDFIFFFQKAGTSHFYTSQQSKSAKLMVFKTKNALSKRVLGSEL